MSKSEAIGWRRLDWRWVILLCLLATPFMRAQQADPAPSQVKAWETALSYPRNCLDDAARRRVQIQPRYHSLDAKQYLVEVGCTWAAYQGTEVFFLLDTSGEPAAKLLVFASYQDNGRAIEKVTTAELPGSAEWDAKTRQLSVFERFSGPGDCGLFQVYSIAGAQTRLLTARGKIKCDSRPIHHPETLPLLPSFIQDSRSGNP